jgi:hypothetical protein
MKTYEIEASGDRARVLEISSDGAETIIGDFPTPMDAQIWIDGRFGDLLRFSMVTPSNNSDVRNQ